MGDLAISLSAIEDALNLGIFQDSVAHNLKRLAEKSAKYTHDIGNRRYGDLIFQIQNNEVVHVFLMRDSKICTSCYGRGKVEQFDPCYVCEGDGCEKCYNLGGHTVLIDCQSCTGRNYAESNIRPHRRK